MFTHTFALINVLKLWIIRWCSLGRTSKKSFFGCPIRHGTPLILEISLHVLSNVADHIKICGSTTERKVMLSGASGVDLSCKSQKKCIFCSPQKGCTHYMFWQLRILKYFIFLSIENWSSYIVTFHAHAHNIIIPINHDLPEYVLAVLIFQPLHGADNHRTAWASDLRDADTSRCTFLTTFWYLFTVTMYGASGKTIAVVVACILTEKSRTFHRKCKFAVFDLQCAKNLSLYDRTCFYRSEHVCIN